MRTTLEEERKALAAFVSKFDSLGLGFTTSASSSSMSLSSSSSTLSTSSSGTLVSSSSSSSLSSLSKMKPPMPSLGGAAATFAERRARANHGFGMAGTTLVGITKLPSLEEVEGSTPTRPPIVSRRVIGMEKVEESPLRMSMGAEMDIMREVMPEEDDLWRDLSFDAGRQDGDDDDEVRAMLVVGNTTFCGDGEGKKKVEKGSLILKKGFEGRVVLGDKENVVPI